ncbi:endonuclease dU [Halococcus agarilyticus]|uniref:endonuclease dU n=1 Tax=Halococcus agarilyticus TaxID=1232219 RepID=UPI00067832E8|nr:DUF99 family protein [Halococcus agarilyticus]
MKAGARALGVAESSRPDAARSTLAGAVVRADRVVDGFAVGSCTVGGTDATETVVALADRLDREDVAYLFFAGIAPAWYNLLDLHRLHAAVDRPVLLISFEASPGLEPALREAFAGDALESRLDVYRAQPPRRRLSVNDETVFVRSVGISNDEAADVVRAFTPEGGRPEPLRVARLAARAADAWQALDGRDFVQED